MQLGCSEAVAKILILEDDTRTAEYVARSLQSVGHQCRVVNRGQDAIDAAKSETIDLLVLDVMLPGGTSGFEVCRRVRADSNLYTLPILILSAMTGEEEIAHGLAQGADDYVLKPFDMQNLLQRIEALIRSNAEIKSVDDMTALPCARVTKREVQRRLSCQESFVLACAELVHLREFGVLCGSEGRTRAIRHLARALNLCAQRFSKDNLVGHMGGGYFVCILHPDEAESFANYVVTTWRSHLPSFYESFDLKKAYLDTVGGGAGPKTVPIMDVLICLTSQHVKSGATPQELFDTLTQLRNNALGMKSTGVHMDRRG